MRGNCARVALLAAFAVGAAGAETVTGVRIGDLEYTLDTERKTAEITDCTGLPTAVNVSSVTNKGVAYAVVSVGAYAFVDRTSITNATLPEVVTVRKEAFEGCAELRSVSLPKATRIEKGTFNDCDKLKEITLVTGSMILNGDSKGFVIRQKDSGR